MSNSKTRLPRRCPAALSFLLLGATAGIAHGQRPPWPEAPAKATEMLDRALDTQATNPTKAVALYREVIQRFSGMACGGELETFECGAHAREGLAVAECYAQRKTKPGYKGKGSTIAAIASALRTGSSAKLAALGSCQVRIAQLETDYIADLTPTRAAVGVIAAHSRMQSLRFAPMGNGWGHREDFDMTVFTVKKERGHWVWSGLVSSRANIIEAVFKATPSQDAEAGSSVARPATRHDPTPMATEESQGEKLLNLALAVESKVPVSSLELYRTIVAQHADDVCGGESCGDVAAERIKILECMKRGPNKAGAPSKTVAIALVAAALETGEVEVLAALAGCNLRIAQRETGHQYLVPSGPAARALIEHYPRMGKEHFVVADAGWQRMDDQVEAVFTVAQEHERWVWSGFEAFDKALLDRVFASLRRAMKMPTR